MTLEELRNELKAISVHQVGTSTIQYDGDEFATVTVFFSADEDIVVPFSLKTIYFLAVRSLEPSTKVNSEKYQSLMRSIERDKKLPIGKVI